MPELKDLTIQQLKSLAKSYELTGYSKLNKSDLIDFIENNLDYKQGKFLKREERKKDKKEFKRIEAEKRQKIKEEKEAKRRKMRKN